MSNQIDDTLERSLREHYQEEGEFHPFAYSIGLESSLREMTSLPGDFPLPQPVSQEALARFFRYLTFLHETTHLTQYLSTAYGLRSLRYVLICLKNLASQPGWTLPILPNLRRKNEPTREESSTMESALLLIDNMSQLTLDHRLFLRYHPLSSGDLSSKPHGQVHFIPWSPHVHMFSDSQSGNLERYVSMMHRIGGHIRKLPMLDLHSPPMSYSLVLNAAALMEYQATLAEFNAIGNALQLPFGVYVPALYHSNMYVALFAYTHIEEICPSKYIIPTMIACIDMALMYDPFILYDVPWDVVDSDGRGDCYPGETFMRALDAVQHVAPIRGLDDLQRFVIDLHQRAGMPSPEWMAQKSLAVATRLLSQPGGAGLLLGAALEAHAEALRHRCENPILFPFHMMTSEGISRVLGAAREILSIYNLHTKKAGYFNWRRMDSTVMYNFLLRAFTESVAHCPLKSGRPFFCDSADSAETICGFDVGDKDGPLLCLAHALGQALGFKAS